MRRRPNQNTRAEKPRQFRPSRRVCTSEKAEFVSQKAVYFEVNVIKVASDSYFVDFF